MLGDGKVLFRLMVNLPVRTLWFLGLILGVWRVYNITFEHIAWHELYF
jgi:hypothetical protein